MTDETKHEIELLHAHLDRTDIRLSAALERLKRLIAEAPKLQLVVNK